MYLDCHTQRILINVSNILFSSFPSLKWESVCQIVSATIGVTYYTMYCLVKERESTNLVMGITTVSIDRMHIELIKMNKNRLQIC